MKQLGTIVLEVYEDDEGKVGAIGNYDLCLLEGVDKEDMAFYCLYSILQQLSTRKK